MMADPTLDSAIHSFPLNKLVQTIEITPYSRNAREHSVAQIEQIVASIREFGFTNPVLLDEHNVLIAGHGRLAAARYLGMPQLPAIVLAGLSDAQKQALRIADNKLALNASWDDDLLRTELMDLRGAGFDLALTGFGEDELLSLFAAANSGLTDPDDVPEPPAEPVSQPGDVWLLGRHRLVCGDATSEVDVSLALAGAKPSLLITDPPYGVELDMEWRDRAGHNEMAPASRSYMKLAMGGKGISGDTIADWSPAFTLVPSLNVAYVWHATSHLIDVAVGLQNIGFECRQQIIWHKTVAAMSRSAYHWRHEPCWYAVRKGKTADWCGSRDQSTVWDAASPKHIMSGSKEEKFDHPTQKPIVLMQRPIENHRGDVYEPFCGSGTTLLAAEIAHRSCYAIEIEPRFVDVAVTRWQNFTGQIATRPDGQAFQTGRREAVSAD